jgi:hypothetical protein
MFLKLVQGENNLEDMGSLFFDVDDDGDLDLYVVSGGSLFSKTRNEMYNDRVYLNNGAGIFTRSQNIIPKTLFSGSVVTAADFDNDGDLDIFRGSRVSAGEFPLTPDSYLFRNDDGVYKDVTSELAKGLQKVGMVTSALWTDYNQDGWFDLIVLGEFMPITFFANHKGRLIVDDQVAVSNSEGWWNSINCGDFDQDGDLDYILGNLGLNSQYKAATGEPLRVYASDYDNNGTVDPILTYHKDGKEVPVAIKDVLHNQLAPVMRNRFKSYAMYSQASIDDVLSRKEISNSQILKAVEMRSCLLKNTGGRKFELNPLPAQAQLSPVFGSLVMDFNGDGFLDALLVGNSNAFDTYTGSVNASMGTLLLGNGQGGFEYVSQNKSGLYLNGDAKSLGYLATGNGSLIIVANNDGVAELIEPINNKTENLPLTSSEVSAKILFKNGKIQWHEMPFGSGYLSQSSRVLPITKEFVDQIYLYDFSGKSTRVLNTKNAQIN